MEEVIYNDLNKQMKNTIDHYTLEMSKIRTGRASTAMLDSVKVDYYGSRQSLKNIAHFSVPEPQLIVITPFDPSSLEMIESAIISSDLDMSPNNDGSVIRLNVPALTEERRQELIKFVHKIIEEGRVSIRNFRREANDKLKSLQKNEGLSEDNLKRALENVQESVDSSIAKLGELEKSKEKEFSSN
ncbi:MAG: ribosome recycling factor [Candidatus Marinimicrobia bacterium]|nr:ribosome recycling factor [Candidatus Neomarinimicrobiota bacterium]|tara:strand:- start:3478 stop:4035 length:558 start_codon:yes stop_codon:yes gene_type:complete